MFNQALRKSWRARLQTAATWQVKIEEDQRVRASSEFQNWLRHELNGQAFAKVSGTWRSIEGFGDAPAIAAIADNAIVRLSQTKPSHLVPVWTWAGAACAIAVVLGVGISFERRPAPDKPIVYASDSKGLRTITLADGSQIWLDASSSVTVHTFTSTGRRITLNSGRAQFSVAHDKTRPFSVTAGNEVTTAVGTAFDVERLKGKLLVTVTQGRVLEESVQQDGHFHQPVSLIKGQQLVAVQNAHISVSQIDLASETAWKSGRIVVDDQPLIEAVERLNRYLKKQVVVDPAVANTKISGVFNVGDLPTFLRALTTAFPVEAEQRADGRVFIRARTAPN
jgi:transmembrane sensor